MATCTQCGANVTAETPCENCGGSATRCVAVPRPAPGSTEPDRDEDHIDAVVLITDRGIEHTRNEDAGAAGTLAGAEPRAIAAVVCDGVSTSSEGQNAARAASAAGVDAMLAALAATGDLTSVMMAGLSDAARAAAQAESGDDALPASSCTYTAAVVVPDDDEVHIAVANVGDSRVYWLPDPPAQPRRLTVDDTLAQQLISGGIPADSPVVERGAHTLTRWFGADAEPPLFDESDVSTMTTADRGVVVLCSDGLHNYLPEPADLAPFFHGAAPTEAARALVDHALKAGGHDNITVIVVPIGVATSSVEQQGL